MLAVQPGEGRVHLCVKRQTTPILSTGCSALNGFSSLLPVDTDQDRLIGSERPQLFRLRRQRRPLSAFAEPRSAAPPASSSGCNAVVECSRAHNVTTFALSHSRWIRLLQHCDCLARWPPSAPAPAIHAMAVTASLSVLFALIGFICGLSSAVASAIPYSTIGPGYVSLSAIEALSAYYSVGAVPHNSSYPTLRFATTLTIDESMPLDPIVEAWQAIIDVTNFRGGVHHQGQPHYVSLTYTNDGDSPILARLAYTDMIASGQYAMFIAPNSDAMQLEINPVLSLYNATMLGMDNADPIDYASHYPYLFSVATTADTAFMGALNAVNVKAQQYFAQTGEGSANGFKTMCMFTADETLLQASASGTREWIDNENSRRGGSDNITLLVDVSWSEDATNSYFDYIPFLLQCPDNTDVMLLMGGSSTGTDVASALQASQLRPKAALGLNIVTQIPYNVVDPLIAGRTHCHHSHGGRHLMPR